MHMHAMVILGLLPTTCVIVLYAAGPHFCVGIELGSAKNPAMAPSPLGGTQDYPAPLRHMPSYL